MSRMVGGCSSRKTVPDGSDPKSKHEHASRRTVLFLEKGHPRLGFARGLVDEAAAAQAIAPLRFVRRPLAGQG